MLFVVVEKSISSVFVSFSEVRNDGLMTFDAETEFRNLPTRKEFVFLRKKLGHVSNVLPVVMLSFGTRFFNQGLVCDDGL